jgi:hypothetical protein
VIVQVETADDRFAESASADQRGKGGRANIDDGARLDSGENRARSDRQENFPKLRAWL